MQRTIKMKIAVFDLDGTLVDSLTDLALSVNKGLRSAGLPEQPLSKYNKFVGNGRDMLVRRAMTDRYSDEGFAKVKAVFDAEYKLHCNDNTTAYPGCPELLERLAANGVATAVLSNKPDEFVAKILQKLYPDHHFAQAWGQKPQYRCKPDRESLDALLAACGFASEDCVYIGDSDVDVLTAKNGGVQMAGVSWGFRGREELMNAGAPFVADTAEELGDYLLSL